MSAQQNQHAPVRLVIAEFSENAAYDYDSLLRDAGIATRLNIIDLPMATEALADADVMICNAALPETDQRLPKLASTHPNVPIILITNQAAPLTTADGLRLGAADVVPQDEREQLTLVFKRELERVCQYHRLCQTRRALKETEQRCQLLLQSSRAAIAYVHEGMHIHANEGYLKLFGFDDADDLLGLPLIDLLEESSVEPLKAELKHFRDDASERTLSMHGKNAEGEPFAGAMTLAAAEYEGESCIQVTVRTATVEHATATESNGAADIELADELAEEFAEEPADEPANDLAESTNGAAGEPAAEDAANGAVPTLDPELDAELDLEPSDASDGAMPKSTDNDETVESFLKTVALDLVEADSQFFGVFVAQIDNFAEFPSEHGLGGAATIAHAVAECLARTLQPSSLLRLGTEQFAFAIAAPTRDKALERAHVYLKAVEEPMLEVNEKTVRPTLTIGGAEIEAQNREHAYEAASTALDSAFAAMLDAVKQFDGNVVELPAQTVEDGDVSAEAGRVLTLINEAIESQKFMLLFQPIISLRGDSDEHYEVFLRMLDRNGEQMVPQQFLRTAIENGVAAKIDRWVILQSIKMLTTHRAKGHNTRLTINLTCNSVTDPEFPQWLGVAIKAARLPSDAVIFQITEQDAATYIRQTREFVEGLKAMHCQASLSRFQLSAESFETLRHIPVDLVKLEGSLIERMMDEEDYKSMVTDTIRQLQSGGKLTIVPMVESANVLSALWQAGANYIQGHYLQEPSTQMDYDFSTDD